MLGYKAEHKDMSDLKIAYPFGKVELIKEEKKDSKKPENSITYYPAIRYTIGLYK